MPIYIDSTPLREYIDGLTAGSKMLAQNYPLGDRERLGGSWVDCPDCGSRGLLKSKNAILTKSGTLIAEHETLIICPMCLGIGMPYLPYLSLLNDTVAA